MININKKLNKIIEWTKVKIRIIKKNRRCIYFREKELWWASLGSNIGYEQDGKNKSFERPVLVIKKFNRYILWVVPLTSQEKTGEYYYNFKYKHKNYSAILIQLRAISSARLLRRIRVFSDEDFLTIKNKIKDFI